MDLNEKRQSMILGHLLSWGRGRESQGESDRRNVPVWRPGGCFQAETGALGADGVRPEAETEEPASRQLVPAMACSSRTPDGKTNG